MADPRMPQEMITWMQGAEWGGHHDQWHFERRWDFWTALANRGNDEVNEMLAYAKQMGWSRAKLQEGEPGSGEDFLMMHRAMIIILSQIFPQHTHFLRGWVTPPRDPSDTEDPVPGGDPFDPSQSAAADRIERSATSFTGDDDYGLFIETKLRPLSGEPLRRSSDPQAGIHNYLHNRWTDRTSDINIGDPKVNLFNHRFWKLHGWIDHQWWRFRHAHGFDDNNSQYKSAVQSYIDMMSGHGAHHAKLRAAAAKRLVVPRPSGFQHSFRE